jgi:DNA repair/transcription protein MET18/MMS19
LVLQDTITQKATNSINALEVYLWLTKALVLRTHALGYELTNSVIEWCGNNTMGSQAPQGFDILIGDDELALNKTTFATTTVSFLIFRILLNRLINTRFFLIDSIQATIL